MQPAYCFGTRMTKLSPIQLSPSKVCGDQLRLGSFRIWLWDQPARVPCVPGLELGGWEGQANFGNAKILRAFLQSLLPKTTMSFGMVYLTSTSWRSSSLCLTARSSRRSNISTAFITTVLARGQSCSRTGVNSREDKGVKDHYWLASSVWAELLRATE